ncbi:MAG: hypothetical protein UR61_C0024G0013 [candidate division WS6 bacterium GW2011_GWE1_34_7]|uniref:Uncharacterized protein n=1 Tax=candidate division WS6 bacterium GW2011_GWE1_34_7 TaxID=1619093 RepID=A0A0G0B7S9_9BACT|nr:MAG: hypothetical protein UR61_C0024G0013 [candidate division WS6 bacterium GW2011_GWE1_34_7]
MLKVLILVIAIVLAVATYIAHPILAGGDKVRGLEGEGTVTQTCITPNYDVLDEYGNPTCPFGDYDPFVVVTE